MKIAFYKSINGTWVDKLTSIVSFSKYSHCELVFSDGMCASSSRRDGGVRFKQIDLSTGNWDVFDLNFSLEEEEIIRYWIGIFVGDEYDYFGAVGSVVGLDIVDMDRKYCSYLCSCILTSNRAVTPGGLYRLLVKAKMI